MKAYHSDPYQTKNFPDTARSDANFDPEAWYGGAQWDVPPSSAPPSDKDIIKKMKTMGARTKITVIKSRDTRYELDVKSGKKTPLYYTVVGHRLERDDEAEWWGLPKWRRLVTRIIEWFVKPAVPQGHKAPAIATWIAAPVTPERVKALVGDGRMYGPSFKLLEKFA